MHDGGKEMRWQLSHGAAPASYHPGARHDPDAGLGVQLLSAGHSGRSDRARSRRLLKLDICRLLRLAGDFGVARPARRPADRSRRRPAGAVDLQSDAGGRTRAARLRNSIPVLVVAWLLLGIGMGAGLYDAAFAALGRIYGDAARRSITGITLIAGFASTVGWPLTALGAGNHRLAQHLLCLGGRAYPDRPAASIS